MTLEILATYREFWRELAAWNRLNGGPTAKLFDPSFRYLLAHPSPIPLWLRAPYAGTIATGMAEFMVLSAVGMAVAMVGERWLFWAPAAAWCLSPVAWGLPENLGGSREPFIVGEGLRILVNSNWFAAAVGLVFVLIPGAAAAVVYRRSPRSPGGDRRWGLVGLASCMFVFWLWLSTKSSFGGSPQSGWTASLPILLPLFVFGAALTITRPWWWVLLAGPALWTVWWVSTVELLPVDMGVFLNALPAALFATCLGASWKTIGVGLDWIASRERLILLLVNVLNIADALMTEFFVHRGLAIESNPLVRVIGLPLKIVFVLAASVVLYRIRPKMLVWPTIFLAAVLAWHMSGVWLNAALLGSP